MQSGRLKQQGYLITYFHIQVMSKHLSVPLEAGAPCALRAPWNRWPLSGTHTSTTAFSSSGSWKAGDFSFLPSHCPQPVALIGSKLETHFEFLWLHLVIKELATGVVCACKPRTRETEAGWSWDHKVKESLDYTYLESLSQKRERK